MLVALLVSTTLVLGTRLMGWPDCWTGFASGFFWAVSALGAGALPCSFFGSAFFSGAGPTFFSAGFIPSAKIT